MSASRAAAAAAPSRVQSINIRCMIKNMMNRVNTPSFARMVDSKSAEGDVHGRRVLTTERQTMHTVMRPHPQITALAYDLVLVEYLDQS